MKEKNKNGNVSRLAKDTPDDIINELIQIRKKIEVMSDALDCTCDILCAYFERQSDLLKK